MRRMNGTQAPANPTKSFGCLRVTSDVPQGHSHSRVTLSGVTVDSTQAGYFPVTTVSLSRVHASSVGYVAT